MRSKTWALIFKGGSTAQGRTQLTFSSQVKGGIPEHDQRKVTWQSLGSPQNDSLTSKKILGVTTNTESESPWCYLNVFGIGVTITVH